MQPHTNLSCMLNTSKAMGCFQMPHKTLKISPRLVRCDLP